MFCLLCMFLPHTGCISSSHSLPVSTLALILPVWLMASHFYHRLCSFRASIPVLSLSCPSGLLNSAPAMSPNQPLSSSPHHASLLSSIESLWLSQDVLFCISTDCYASIHYSCSHRHLLKACSLSQRGADNEEWRNSLQEPRVLPSR